MSRPGSAHSQHADLAHEIAHGDHHAHQNEHGRHHGGFKGWLVELFVPHTHDAADSIDDAMEASIEGVRALKVSLFLLLGTTVLQFLVVLISGSVALLADTIHNFSDALTAVPLWVAFILGRRAATRRYTYGFGRAEDLAGLFIVAAGLIGFAGNEAVAIYRIRVGRRIGSAALVADGVHARTDGFTSLAVVLGAVGVMLGFPLADPIIAPPDLRSHPGAFVGDCAQRRTATDGRYRTGAAPNRPRGPRGHSWCAGCTALAAALVRAPPAGRCDIAGC